MLRRRTIVPRPLGTRRRAHYLWIRQQFDNVTPIPTAAFDTNDLLAGYRATAGIDLNLPEFTIWRVRLKVSVRISVAPATTYTSSDGAIVALYVDDKTDSGTNPVTSPYDEKYMVYDILYASQSIQNGGNGGLENGANSILMFREFDVKTHRRLENLASTLQLQIAPTGLQTSILDYSIQHSTLGRLRN
jgi:hypothetical protein